VAAALGEDEVSRPQPREADRSADAQLLPGRAREVPADRPVRRVDEARAVEAGRARRAAPAVRDAELPSGVRDDLARQRLNTRRMRWIAQKRLMAVGRVAAKVRQMRSKSRAASLRNVRAPSAMPIAAATPIAGAPRITISLMARATSRYSL